MKGNHFPIQLKLLDKRTKWFEDTLKKAKEEAALQRKLELC
jgi:hypothetical protein